MPEFVLDTDIASAAFKNKLSPEVETQLRDTTWCVSFATAGELWQWAAAKRWGPAARSDLEAWLGRVPVLGSRRNVQRAWGGLAGRARLRGCPKPMNDTWIAACCLTHDLPLVTGNVKDYEDYAEHEGLRIIRA